MLLTVFLPSGALPHFSHQSLDNPRPAIRRCSPVSRVGITTTICLPSGGAPQLIGNHRSAIRGCSPFSRAQPLGNPRPAFLGRLRKFSTTLVLPPCPAPEAARGSDP